MSDLLIRGMEMPKDGDKVYMITFSDGKACASDKPFEWHEIVSVPTYERLGDLGKLAEYFDNLEKEHPFLRFTPSAVGSILRSECYSPTIVQAEEET